MPHRVTSFFRSPNDSISNIKHSVQRRRSPSARTPTSTSRRGDTRTFSYASSLDIDAAALGEPMHPSVFFPAPPPTINGVRMPSPERKDKEAAHHHRLSFPGLHLSSKLSREHYQQHPNASLDWKIESPPAVMYGDAENSTGALISGQLLLAVKEVPFEVESFEARLDIHVIHKRPFTGHCNDCINQTTELKKWTFLSEPTALTQRVHEFPFSVLLDGHLPASTDNCVLAIRYDFSAEVKPKTGPNLKLNKSIDVKRSLPVPDLPHHSVRIFPPTNIAASVHYPQVIHPMGSNTMQLRLDGIVKTNPDVKTVEYWKLKRVSWKLEEHINTVAPACAKHMPKETTESGDGPKKGATRTEARTIGAADLSSGWKSDYSPGGSVEMELDYQCAVNAKAVCDMKSNDGTHVTHQLVVEMVVVQEYAPISQPKHFTPTGIARILRMHFGTTVTERAGLGVSWDNEAPPIYQDVPPSPPAYSCAVPFGDVESLSDLSEHSCGSCPPSSSGASR